MKSKFQLIIFALFTLAGCLTLTLLPTHVSGQSLEAQAAPAPADAHSSDGEVLKVNDLIRITVYKEDDMLTEARISKEGIITVPLIGAVHVAGKTVSEAASEIRTRLDKDYIINPQVTLTIMEYAPQWVTVLGEVQKPSQVQIPPQGGLDLMGAIAMAGGYTRIADPSRIIVRRTVNGREQVMKIDARKLASDPRSSPFIVEPGDTISVAESVW